VADFLREQGVEAKSAEVILSIISSMGKQKSFTSHAPSFGSHATGDFLELLFW
jgi:hypothetical protein